MLKMMAGEIQVMRSILQVLCVSKQKQNSICLSINLSLIYLHAPAWLDTARGEKFLLFL